MTSSYETPIGPRNDSAQMVEAQSAMGLRPLSVTPNPFNSTIAFSLAGRQAVGASLKVFDLSGKLVADLTEKVSAGQAVWNAEGFAPGVYMAAVQKGGLRLVRKIVLQR